MQWNSYDKKYKPELCDLVSNLELCYNKLVLLQGKKTYLYLVPEQHTTDRNDDMKILVLKSVDNSNIEIDEVSLNNQKIRENPKANEIIDCLENKFQDSEIKQIGFSYGLIGMLKIIDQYVLIFVAEAQIVGSILKHEIFLVKKINVLPIFKMEESKTLKQLRDFLNEPDLFYYSYTYDLTASLSSNFLQSYRTDNFYYSEAQASYNVRQNESSRFLNDVYKKFGKNTTIDSDKEDDDPITKIEHQNFMWNQFAAENLVNLNKCFDFAKEKWAIKLMHGFYKQIQSDILANTITVHLISRRQVQNCGTRYLRRGLNDMGFAANFVETEQQVVNETLLSNRKPLQSSYIQVRGSVPLYWHQESRFTILKPKITLTDDYYYYGSQKHLADLVSLYGPKIICMNLMKKPMPNEKKHREVYLGIQYKYMLESLKSNCTEFKEIQYRHVDFKGTLGEDREEFMITTNSFADHVYDNTSCFVLDGYYMHDRKYIGEQEFAMKLQNGVLRTNCVDCLDRTNKYQSIVGERILEKQINEVLHLKNQQKDPQNKEFKVYSKKIIEDFRALWKKHGDQLALQYAGSKAHNQGDDGSIKKVLKSTQRHISNSLYDNIKQRQMRIFTGDLILADKMDEHLSENIIFVSDPILRDKCSIEEHCKPGVKVGSLLKKSHEIIPGIYVINNETIINRMIYNNRQNCINRNPSFDCFHDKISSKIEFLKKQNLNKKNKYKQPQKASNFGTAIFGHNTMQQHNVNYSDNEKMFDNDPSKHYIKYLDYNESKFIKEVDRFEEEQYETTTKNLANYDLDEYVENDLIKEYLSIKPKATKEHNVYFQNDFSNYGKENRRTSSRHKSGDCKKIPENESSNKNIYNDAILTQNQRDVTQTEFYAIRDDIRLLNDGVNVDIVDYADDFVKSIETGFSCKEINIFEKDIEFQKKEDNIGKNEFLNDKQEKTDPNQHYYELVEKVIPTNLKCFFEVI